MKASEAKLLDVLLKASQFIIPIYQRTYSWTERECAQLWNDIMRSGQNEALTAHFVGSIVYIESGPGSISVSAPLLVIDGQQRLTTISLLLEALARRLGDDEPVDGFSSAKLRSYYLLRPLEKGDRHFKLLLTQTDRDSLIALVQQKSLPSDASIRVEENFAYFQNQIAELDEVGISALCHGLSKLVIVDISLNRSQDNPQLIFESMNSTGRELSQADLIRNFVLMGLEPDIQTALYREHWRPLELLFGQEAYGVQFDAFMRHFLTVRTGEIPNIGAVYDAFKGYARDPETAAKGIEVLLADIHDNAGYYCAMALGKEPDPQLSAAFRDLRELKVDVAYPFLLELYSDYVHHRLSKADFVAVIRLIEAYVFRRAVCGIPTNTLNKTFATFMRSVKKERYRESIEAHLLLLTSYRRFPLDDEFKREIKTKDLYNFRTRSYLLRKLENADRKEPIDVNQYTIEHILPQNDRLSASWREALGVDWKKVQQVWLHTLGNLTLTGYNSEYGDRPWREKRDMPGGFRDSPLRLNKGLAAVDQWNEAAIRARADRLATTALAVWPEPKLSAAQVASFRPQPGASAVYSINSFPHLAPVAPMRPVFDAFRREILALDPSITEEFLKLYVAYKAETNIVDVVPQVKKLRLSINMPFNEVNDPEVRCTDITNLGRWGNGDVEVNLSTLNDVPYAVGIVRQALERQLGNGGEQL